MLTRSIQFICLALGLACLAKGSYIPAKAAAAQILMQRAWHKTQNLGVPVPAWRGMDAKPAAKLRLPNNSSHIVLSIDSGQALAFGPAFIHGASPIDDPVDGPQMLAIAAHKNTQFKSLKSITAGDIIKLDFPAGRRAEYRAEKFEIIDTRKQGLPQHGGDMLALVTCYPFDAVRFNGPMRYVVYARKTPQNLS